MLFFVIDILIARRQRCSNQIELFDIRRTTEEWSKPYALQYFSQYNQAVVTQRSTLTHHVKTRHQLFVQKIFCSQAEII